MKKLIILLFSILISINSYGGIFSETVCFETSGQNIVFLPNDIYPYSGNTYVNLIMVKRNKREDIRTAD